MINSHSLQQFALIYRHSKPPLRKSNQIKTQTLHSAFAILISKYFIYACFVLIYEHLIKPIIIKGKKAIVKTVLLEEN